MGGLRVACLVLMMDCRKEEVLVALTAISAVDWTANEQVASKVE